MFSSFFILKSIFYEIKIFFSCKIFFKKNNSIYISSTKEFESEILSNRLHSIKNEFSSFLKAQNIREDLYLFEIPTPNPLAIGYNRKAHHASKAAIVMPEGLFDLNPKAFSFLLKHEISHLKYYDIVIGKVLTAASTLGLFLGLTILLGYPISLLITYFLALPMMDRYVGNAYAIFREKRADKFAYANSDLEELKGGLLFFLAIEMMNKEASQMNPLFDENGDLESMVSLLKLNSAR